MIASLQDKCNDLTTKYEKEKAENRKEYEEKLLIGSKLRATERKNQSLHISKENSIVDNIYFDF